MTQPADPAAAVVAQTRPSMPFTKKVSSLAKEMLPLEGWTAVTAGAPLVPVAMRPPREVQPVKPEGRVPAVTGPEIHQRAPSAPRQATTSLYAEVLPGVAATTVAAGASVQYAGAAVSAPQAPPGRLT